MREKMCSRCLRDLPVAEFPRMGKSAVCRDCKFGPVVKVPVPAPRKHTPKTPPKFMGEEWGL